MGSGLSLLFTLNSTHSRIFDTSGFSARDFLCRRRFGRSQIRRAFCGCEPRLANIEIQGQAYLVHRRIRPPFYISEAKPILLVSESPPRRGIRRYGLRPDTVPPPATIRAGHGILNGRSAAARPRLHDDAGNRTAPLPCNPTDNGASAPARHSFALRSADRMKRHSPHGCSPLRPVRQSGGRLPP